VFFVVMAVHFMVSLGASSPLCFMQLGRDKKVKVKQSHYRPAQAQKVPGS